MNYKDQSIPLINRVIEKLLNTGKANCDDFLCSEEELAVIINKIENRTLH